MPDLTLRARFVVAAVCAAVVGAGVCWALADPEPSSVVAAIGVAAVSLLMGLGLLPLIGEEPPLIAVIAAAGVWGTASVIGGWLQVAQRAGVSPFAVSVGDVMDGVASGLPVLVGAMGALVVLGWAFAALRAEPPVLVVGVVAAVGVLSVAVTGHGGQSSWLPLVLGVHALGAAWWSGTLGALVVAVRGRGGWARALPEFSRWALPVVVALTVTGVVAAVAQIGIGTQLWDTGYGRLLILKAVLLAAGVALAAWHRGRWLPRARRHGVSERDSLIHAGGELVLLTLILGVAAGLATVPVG